MRRLRTAFTLVELLVVIAIIGVLVALLLPAVQAAREASRRSSCQNNLKQSALGMLNFEDVYRTLPGGMGKYGCCWGTWQARLLPYIEQGAMGSLYVNLDGHDGTGQRYNGAINRPQVTSKRLKAWTCPSDIPNAPIGGTPPITSHNYSVNFGNTSYYQEAITQGGVTIQFLGAPFTGYPGGLATGDDGPVNAAEAANWTRIYGKPVRLAEITDGLSNTLLMAEVIQGRNTDLRGFSWWGNAGGFVTYLAPNSNSPDVVTGGNCCFTGGNCTHEPRNPPCVVASTASRPRMMAARSRHPNGVQVSFCDGHVSFVPNNVNYALWQAVGSAQGGDSTGDLQ
jgi:prepilin-type N-terminal cleavage/methylation domain-containing protein/prepilin-type processing-associated H-X9-DG protein